jgi:prevent-host-death family protein
MQTFKLSELQNDPDALLRNTKEGHVSLVTRDGEPVFVTVPVDERLISTGFLEFIAVNLFRDQVLSLGRAAELARQPVERFLESLAAAGIPAASYDPSDLERELASFA